MPAADAPREIAAWAARQLADYRDREPGTLFADPGFRLTREQAYAVQLEVARLREAEGERRAGFKVGCTSPRIQEQFGMAGPISGIVWAGELHPCGAMLASGHYAQLGLEAELALRLGPDLEPAAALVVIELHNHVFRSEPRALPELIANNGIHAGVVLPCTGEAALPEDVERRRISLQIGGRTVETGLVGDVPGGPLGSLRWLRAQLDSLGQRLHPGDLVLTGTPLGIHHAEAGDEVVAEVEGLGVSRATIA